jgi:uncharacterized protein (TIGR03435 family)
MSRPPAAADSTIAEAPRLSLGGLVAYGSRGGVVDFDVRESRKERMNRRSRFVATLAVFATPALFGATAATSGLRATSIQSPLQFEVASVKVNRSASAKVDIPRQLGDRFTATNVTLRQLIQHAYQLQEFLIVGGPSWMPTDRFDIVAKAEGDGSRESGQVDTAGAPSREQLMLRALLAERFSLRVHTDTKELPIYALVAAQRDGTPGPQLRQSAQACESRDVDSRMQNRQAPSIAEPPRCGMRILPGTIQSGGVLLAQLATGLSPLVGRVVRDRTGLAGYFEFTLRWTPDQIPQGYDRKAAAIGLPPIETDGASIFTALREQLGLRLDSEKGPVEILVVDRAERPVEN